MSEENLAIVRRAVEAYNRGDLDAAVADMAPECEYLPSRSIPGAADVARGPEGFKRFQSWLLDQFDDVRAEVHELTAVGDQVVLSLTNLGRGKLSGAETSWHVWQVWTFRDGKIVRGQGFTGREEALKAAGLGE